MNTSTNPYSYHESLKEDTINYRYVWRICLVAAMGGFLFGYDWVVIGGAKQFYEAFFGITGKDNAFWQGWAMSSALFGCIFGAMLSGGLSDKLGRKKLLIFSGFLYTLSAVGTGLAWDFSSFNVFRVIGGVGIGLSSNLSPMFIAETSPAASRGRFVSINQLTIVIGILSAQIINLLIAEKVAESATTAMILESWNGQTGWRWMFAAEAFPAFGFFVLMFFVPESPRWLVKNGRPQKAEKILTRIGGESYAASEVREIQATISAEETSHVRFGDLFDKRLFPVLLLGIYLAVYQQWCGINVIFNYAEDIFKAAGYDVSAILFTIVITGIVNLVFTFVAIATVDRLGRKPLMLFGASGLGIIYALMGAGYFFGVRGLPMLVLVLLAIACYAMTLAPIVWVVISEIFPNRIRGAAMSTAVLFLWIGCAALTFTFPLLNAAFQASGTFWIYGAISVVSFFVIYRFLPETKGKSLEQIEAQWSGPTGT